MKRVRDASINDPTITAERLLWKRKTDPEEFFRCAQLTNGDQLKFENVQKECYRDQNDNICLLVQCDAQSFPDVQMQTASFEVFRGYCTQKKPFCVRPKLKIDQLNVYIARTKELPKFVLGKHEFHKVKDIKNFCKKILVEHKHGACFLQHSVVHEFLFEFLKYHQHPDFNTLTTNDIRYFKVDQYDGPYFYNYSFYVALTNGVVSSFNYEHCFNVASKMRDLKSSLRRYVWSQISEFKRTSLKTFSKCPFCEGSCTDNLQVDHVNPQFSHMVMDFLADIGNEQADGIMIYGYGLDAERKSDNCPFDENDVSGLWITPASIAQQWVLYHQKHAVLRLLCKRCNQKRKQTIFEN